MIAVQHSLKCLLYFTLPNFPSKFIYLFTGLHHTRVHCLYKIVTILSMLGLLSSTWDSLQRSTIFQLYFFFLKSKITSLHRLNFSFSYFSFQSEQITKSGPPQRPRFPLSPRGGPRPLRPPFGFGPRPRGPPPHLMRPPSVRLNLPTQSQSVSPSTAVVASSGDPLTKPPPSPSP